MIASLCVLASGSRGNCSVVRLAPANAPERLLLIDAGLAPRRTAQTLASLGLSLDQVADVFLTHLDNDHFNPTWVSALPPNARFHVHWTHRARAHRAGITSRRTEWLDGPRDIRPGCRVSPLLLRHDDLGTAAMRFDFDLGAGRLCSLGFATDAGRATEALVALLAGVDVLAIESNYCPRLQLRSGRPWYLKSRIMGGAGHLSNEQSAIAARQIRPRRHVALLHLSQECNEPDRALAAHAPGGYPVTLTWQDRPSPWIDLLDAGEIPAPVPTTVPTPDIVVARKRSERQGTLFAL